MIHLIISVLMCFILFPVQLWAAINCNDANKVSLNDATPLDPETGTPNYTPPNEANRVTFLLAGYRHGSTSTTITPMIGGNSPTGNLTAQFTDPAGGNLFYFVNLPISSLTISVDWGVLPLADAVYVWTCTGVNTTNPFYSTSQSTGSGTTASSTPGTAPAGSMLVDAFYKDNPADGTPDASQTLLFKGNDASESAAGVSYKTSTGSGLMQWTFTTEQWVHFSVALRPDANPGVFRRQGFAR